MAHTHHPHLFSREWFDLHPALVTRFKRYGVALGMGTLITMAAVLVTKLELELGIPLKVAMAVDLTSGAFSVPVVAANYLPGQFFDQEIQAKNEELPPLF